jgi:hypothetical protein
MDIHPYVRSSTGAKINFQVQTYDLAVLLPCDGIYCIAMIEK